MKRITLGNSDLETSEIALGCMRMNELSPKDAEGVIENALNLGIDFFDHADIYGKGVSESVFAGAINMTDDRRESIKLQTKCGIRDGFFDFSKEHIIESVEGSLRRLQTDYVDSLLLHRPDALMEPEEVAEAFAILKESGKVRHFGVSNQNPAQMDLMKQYLGTDLIANQLQLSLVHTPMIDAGFNVNMANDPAIVRDGNVLEYCRQHNITIQAWSPFQHGMIQGPFIDNPMFPDINHKLNIMAAKKEVSNSAIAIAWILRHPAVIQPVVGTMNMERLSMIAQASDVELSREEWYELYRAAGNDLP